MGTYRKSQVREAEGRTGASGQMPERGHLQGQNGSTRSEQRPRAAQAGMGEGIKPVEREVMRELCLQGQGVGLPLSPLPTKV